jgi:ribosomal protein S18 acetylase RimI-like enzyme
MGMSEPRIVTPDDPAVAPLLAGLDEEYRALYGAAVDGELEVYDGAEFAPPLGAFLVVESDGATVAGGALRRLADGIGEVKRMWTAPDHRGRGHGRRVLGELEHLGRRYGYRALRLQTGDAQTAAIALYRSAGYRPIERYGRYRDEPRCLCFEKTLAMA